MFNSIAIGVIEIGILIFCFKIFVRVENLYKKNNSNTTYLWLMVLIIQTVVVYILSFLRLILLALPYKLDLVSSNLFFFISITHNLFIFTFPAFVHSVLKISKIRNIPFIIFLGLNILLMLTSHQMAISNSDFYKMLNSILFKTVNTAQVIFIIYLILVLFLVPKERHSKKIAYLTSGILFLHIIYTVYLGFFFSLDSFKTELSIYSIFFWISLPRDIYMIAIFYHLFYNFKETDRVLTDREMEILKLLLNKCKSKDIALELNISLSTVNSHIYRIYKKRGVSSKKQLIKQYS